MTDTGSAYISVLHAVACRALGIRHSRTRPRRPRTNGKAERFIRTMLGEWAYGAIYATSAERTAALPGWLERYNTEDLTAVSATSPQSADSPTPTYSGPTPSPQLISPGSAT